MSAKDGSAEGNNENTLAHARAMCVHQVAYQLVVHSCIFLLCLTILAQFEPLLQGHVCRVAILHAYNFQNLHGVVRLAQADSTGCSAKPLI
jgi:hypothetical protein